MFRGVHFEDVVKSAIGLAVFTIAVVAFGPGLLHRLGLSTELKTDSSLTPSPEYETALKIEADHRKLDVLNIRTLDDRVVMTVLDNAYGNWSEEDVAKLTKVTFYLVDLAREGELAIESQIWSETEALSVESEPVEVFLHQESLICAWHVIKKYDGTNAAPLLRQCLVFPGNALAIADEDIPWVGRSN
ncbi:MAG: hypothetical protein GTO14_18920 [Anaerolineales bacterium]|nr:hypothetical protein [Anaerolineales bacterium]